MRQKHFNLSRAGIKILYGLQKCLLALPALCIDLMQYDIVFTTSLYLTDLNHRSLRTLSDAGHAATTGRPCAGALHCARAGARANRRVTKTLCRALGLGIAVLMSLRVIGPDQAGPVAMLGCLTCITLLLSETPPAFAVAFGH